MDITKLVQGTCRLKDFSKKYFELKGIFTVKQKCYDPSRCRKGLKIK